MSDFSQRIKKTLLAALGIVVVAGAGGTWWYLSIYTKTPDYALQKIEKSVVDNDKEEFYKFVNVEHLLDSAGDELLSGLMNSVGFVEDDKNREAITDFGKIFKAPLINILQKSVDNYILTGEWNSEQLDGDAEISSSQVVAKIGIANLDFEGIDSLEKSDEENAVAKIKAYQQEAKSEFIFDVQMKKSAEGVWQIYEIQNFKEFINFVTEARKAQIRDYIGQTNLLVTSCDTQIRSIEKNISMAISTGSLSDDKLRSELKGIVTTELMVQWQKEKAALEEIDVPSAAGTLHKIRIKICDANIAYAENYAKWLDSKDIKDIRKAEENMRLARTLEKEAEHLIRQIMMHAAE